MKTYTSPETTVVTLRMEQSLLDIASPGGVTDGSTLGDEYSEDDQSYARRRSSLWDDDAE